MTDREICEQIVKQGNCTGVKCKEHDCPIDCCGDFANVVGYAKKWLAEHPITERKLNEQWIEELDGKRHMYKAAEAINKEHVCNGCAFNNGTCDYQGDECPVPKGCYIKDLGILNEDGCLPSPWGGYPKIIHEVDQNRTENGEDVHYDNLWCVEIHEPVLVCTDEYPTEQEAIDAWNRRM